MKRVCFIALLVALLVYPSDVYADVAPPIYPPGSNPGPGTEVTQVRMAAETVLIEIPRDLTPGSLGRARVTADFRMRNLGAADERMAVRFPISGNDGRGGYPEIGSLLIAVNGKRLPHRRASYPDIGYSDENVPWAEFDVTFPAGEEVTIRVAYDLQGSGYFPFTAFYYVLETGAGWKDTIGSADVILRLPYEATPLNVVMDAQIGWAETTSGGVFKGNEVRWHFEEFEPGRDQPVHNMEFALVAPSAWEAALTARANTLRNPDDGEAWGLLGKAYKQAFFLGKGYREDAGGQELYRLSLQAYEKCLSLKPDDAQWHAGFADLLAQRAMWDSWRGPGPETFRALQEIHTALELAPDDPVVRGIAENMTYMIYDGITQNGEEFEFPWLTRTPTAPASAATAAPLPETTATPPAWPAATEAAPSKPVESTPSQTKPAPAPQASNPLCGSAALLPLFAAAWFVTQRK